MTPSGSSTPGSIPSGAGSARFVTRSPRDGRPGAPLWRLVDLASGVAPAEVDGLEAALTGAGLIDAWVQPDGAVDLGDDRADVVLTARPAAVRTLGDLLVPVATAEE